MSVYINVVERYIKIPLYIVLAALFLLFAPNCIFADEIPENELRQPFRWKSAGEAFQYQITISTRNALTGLWEQCYYHETDREETDSCPTQKITLIILFLESKTGTEKNVAGAFVTLFTNGSVWKRFPVLKGSLK